MSAKPFESRIQDLVYNVDAGIGVTLIKSFLYILIVGTIILLFTATQFKGLKDAEAMDYAQLGRNWMTHRQLITQNVRPASIWYLNRDTEGMAPRIHNHPDIVHAPLYPMMLGAWFQLTGAEFAASPEGPLQVFQPEYRIMVLNHLFTLLTALLLYLLALRLFDRRVAMLGVTVFILSDLVWRDSLSGTGVSVVAFWAVAAAYAMVVAVGRISENAPLKRWIGPVLLSALLCAAAFLTRYAAIALVPGLALYLGWALKGRGWVWGPVFIGVVLLLVSPWFVRNVAVSGSPLGLAPYTALNESSLFSQNSFERSLYPELKAGEVSRSLREKAMKNLRTLYDGELRTIGDGILIGLFFTTFFYRFVRFPVHSLRWALALSLFLLLLIASFFGQQTFRVVLMFWPFVILYGLAFFTILLDRLQFRAKLYNALVSAALIFLCALPMVLALLPPRTATTYPPYAPGPISFVSRLLEDTELMCTDMPWATAWYGSRTSVLLPVTLDEFYDVNDYMHRFSGLFFTPLTRDQPFVRRLQSPIYETWFPILQGRIPGDFPLPQALPLIGVDHIFLSDRARWQEQ